MMNITLLYFVFNFLTYEVSYSKNIKFAIDSSKLYFANQGFAI